MSSGLLATCKHQCLLAIEENLLNSPTGKYVSDPDHRLSAARLISLFDLNKTLLELSDL